MLIRRAHVAIFVIVGVATVAVADEPSADGNTKRITVTVDRGQDVGQSFGSLFEMTSSDGSVVIGAGFQNLYNTRYRADRHSLQFFVRPTSDERSHITETLPRPNELCGTYLYSRDDVVRSTYGGVTAWNQQESCGIRNPVSAERMRPWSQGIYGAFHGEAMEGTVHIK